MDSTFERVQLKYISADGMDPAQIEWVRDHGMVPEDISPNRIGIDDKGDMHFLRYLRNEKGKRYMVGNHMDGHMATDVVVVTPTRPFPV